MKYNIAESKLKDLGYTFQKLYANNYKTYRKEIHGYTLWLWSKNKQIEINDWYGNTETILKFFKDNVNSPIFEEFSPSKNGPKGYIVIQMNPQNGFVQFRDYETYYEVLMSKDWSEWNRLYEGWHNEIVLNRGYINEILKEIEILQDEKV